MANTTFVLRSQGPVPLGAGEVWNPPPCVLSSCICRPAGSLSLLPQPPYPCLLGGYDCVWLLDAPCVNLSLLGREFTGRIELPISLGPWGQGCFCWCWWQPLLNDGWRDQKSDSHPTSHFFPEIKMGWGECWKETAFVRGRKRILRDGNWGREGEMRSVTSWWLSFFKILPLWVPVITPRDLPSVNARCTALHICWVTIPAPSLPRWPWASYLMPLSLSSSHVGMG